MNPRVLAAVAAVLLAVSGLIVAFSGGDDSPPTKTVPVPQVGPDTAVQIDEDQQREAGEEAESAHGTPLDSPLLPVPTPTSPANPVTPDVHEDMKDEVPAGVTPAEVKIGRSITYRKAREQLGKKHRPAGAQGYSCPAHYVRNRSSLSGPRVGMALHFTVSAPGSLQAIWGLFNTPSFAASSNFGFEPISLRCETWVPTSQKAWAQGAANSAYESVEIMSYDRTRAQWLAYPMIRSGVLAALVRDRLRAIGAPLKLVDPVGCSFDAGLTDHDRLECGNTHYDLGRNFPWDVFMKQVQQGVRSYGVTKAARHQCNIYNQYTTRLEEEGHLGSYGEKRREKAKRYFIKNHNKGKTNYDCYRGPPPHGHVRVREVSS